MDIRPTERIARAIAKARYGTDAYWPNYLLAAAAAAAARKMNAILAGAQSPNVVSLSGDKA